jgi:septum formation protein
MTKSDRQHDVTAKPLILASASPRRRELMRQHGYDVTIIPPPHEEPTDLGERLPPSHLARELSRFKANSVRSMIERGIILAGDTVVALEDRIFGKPTDREDARSIISAIAGTTHHVITGVTLLDASTDETLTRHDSTAVTMRRLSDDELEAYLDTGAWEGKAGAYGIQDRGDAFVTKVEGSFTNVVGFPMELVGQMLKQWGIEPNGPESRGP